MKEKKNGKLIFGIVVILILALQSPVRMSVYHFFTKNDVATQAGVRQEVQKKVKHESINFFEKIQKEMKNILDGLKNSQEK
ncbi:MAG: hypothetical protein MUW51_11370 [Lactococcus lactis]|uniref:Na+-transporting NADH:ubiquinone oxidoreductase subunit NqrE n=1 Tax=Lactococcus lactis TaxID=1358 RepID=A0AAW5TGP6_9LACT|nr:hypothetical protein [Lactococcus lactis]MCJ7969476.1 hypothetical protein [Lactococcus lactis]MCW2280219.1 Na+-transporting NADH:ubiquinone oxidoreductase subunit NqrE [Lactococcus lactis]